MLLDLKCFYLKQLILYSKINNKYMFLSIMIFFNILFIKTQIDMFEDSFAIVNRKLPDQPLTIFNVDSGDLTMPLRLTELNDNLLLTQLFMIRFNYENKFWLSSIVKTGYRSVNGFPFLVARYRSPEPNLSLEYVRNLENDKVYKITSEKKCMTVGEINSKGETPYFPLEFKECTNTPAQEFIFIPRLVVEKFLKKEKVSNLQEIEVKEAYEKLYRNLRISINYNLKGEVETEDSD